MRLPYNVAVFKLNGRGIVGVWKCGSVGVWEWELGCAPKVRQRVKVGSGFQANAVLQFAKRLSQSRQRLVKRKRALLESNPPGIINRRLIKPMSEGVAGRPRPLNQQLISQAWFEDLIDLLMPKKTHVCASATFDFDRLRSNSAGGT